MWHFPIRAETAQLTVNYTVHLIRYVSYERVKPYKGFTIVIFNQLLCIGGFCVPSMHICYRATLNFQIILI